jgi:hypothetical protein
MKKITTTTLFLFFLVVIGGCSSMQEKKIREEVLLPKGYQGGCSYIVYDVKDAPELELKDDTIIYNLNDNGVLATSSPEHFGWDNKETSPNLDRHYYYVNKNNDKEEISLDNIQHEGNGATSKEGTEEITFRHFYLGTEKDFKKLEEESKSCLDYDEVKQRLSQK